MKRLRAVFAAAIAAVIAAASLLPGCAQQASAPRPLPGIAVTPQQIQLSKLNALHNAIAGVNRNPRLTSAEKAKYIRQLQRQYSMLSHPKPAAARGKHPGKSAAEAAGKKVAGK